MKELSASLKEFVEKAELLRLAYVDEAGYPHAVPLWFVVRDGAFYFGTDPKSPKWRALRRNPRAGWLIDGGPQGAYKGASYRGAAEEVTDPALRASVYEAMGVKYFGSATHEKYVEIYGAVDEPRTIYAKLTPEAVFAWEY